MYSLASSTRARPRARAWSFKSRPRSSASRIFSLSISRVSRPERGAYSSASAAPVKPPRMNAMKAVPPESRSSLITPPELDVRQGYQRSEYAEFYPQIVAGILADRLHQQAHLLGRQVHVVVEL